MSRQTKGYASNYSRGGREEGTCQNSRVFLVTLRFKYDTTEGEERTLQPLVADQGPWAGISPQLAFLYQPDQLLSNSSLSSQIQLETAIKRILLNSAHSQCRGIMAKRQPHSPIGLNPIQPQPLLGRPLLHCLATSFVWADTLLASLDDRRPVRLLFQTTKHLHTRQMERIVER
jgi:hypothetical protein